MLPLSTVRFQVTSCLTLCFIETTLSDPYRATFFTNLYPWATPSLYLTSLNYGSRRDPIKVAGGETTGKGVRNKPVLKGQQRIMGTEQLHNAMELSGAAFSGRDIKRARSLMQNIKRFSRPFAQGSLKAQRSQRRGG